MCIVGSFSQLITLQMKENHNAKYRRFTVSIDT